MRRPVRSSSFGAAGKPLEIWLHYLALLPAVDPYLAAAVSLARCVLGGAGAVMVHYTRVQGLTDYVTRRRRSRARPATSACASASRWRCGTGTRWSTARRSRSWALPPEARERDRAAFIRAPLPVADQIALVER